MGDVMINSEPNLGPVPDHCKSIALRNQPCPEYLRRDLWCSYCQSRWASVEEYQARFKLQYVDDDFHRRVVAEAVGEQVQKWEGRDSEYIPVGTILSDNTVYTGQAGTYLPLDGRSVAAADYPELFAVLGTIFGAGDGPGTFRLLDVQDWKPVRPVVLGQPGKTHITHDRDAEVKPVDTMDDLLAPEPITPRTDPVPSQREYSRAAQQWPEERAAAAEAEVERLTKELEKGHAAYSELQRLLSESKKAPPVDLHRNPNGSGWLPE